MSQKVLKVTPQDLVNQKIYYVQIDKILPKTTKNILQNSLRIGTMTTKFETLTSIFLVRLNPNSLISHASQNFKYLLCR